MPESTDNHSDSARQEDTVQFSLEYWRQQAEASRAAIARLAARLRGRDRRIELLELAIARTVVMHHVWAGHLERKLERSPVPAPNTQPGQSRAEPELQNGVIVRLPHLTGTLEALFDVMREHWSQWDPERPPKSSTVARAIDEKLGLKGQANGEASRSAQTFAAALRPDSVNEKDGRHR
ncbi:hypothetical protein [Caballeronia sp. dw_19]|uniref:hypothetical protein n=1 Tax=Caballeronia sp. dw_19 TaxID=2719791 RepID=UPI001BCBD4A7|nr:hypothetical protein [Caballeronia sp. dw_19]